MSDDLWPPHTIGFIDFINIRKGNTMELLKPVGALLLVYQQSVHYNGSIGLGFNFLLQKLCRQCYEG